MVMELYIENRRLDVDANISALLQFALDDIKDFSSRSTTWSKTIVLPGTQNNNQLFGHIFQIGQANYYDTTLENVGYNFNAAKSAECIILQDHVQTFKGILRLLQINLYRGKIDYEVSVFGKLSGLNVALSGALIEDLDFSAYDHVFNDGNIVDSWDNPGGSGYYYPLIDYGTYSSNKHDWRIGTFRPALYVKEYIDKMFAAAGFRYESELFETDRFQRLIVPHNAKVLTANITKLYEATITTPKPKVIPNVGFGTTAGGVLIDFDTVNLSGFTADAGKTIFTYNGSVTSNLTIEFEFNFTFNTVNFPFGAILYLHKNGDGNPIYNAVIPPPSPYSLSGSVSASFSPGDTIQYRILQTIVTGEIVDFVVQSGEFTVTSAGGSGVPVPIQIGDTVRMNDAIPKNFRQIDFLLGIVKLFNLYVYEDKFDPSLIHLRPYIDFYSTDQSTSVDWTLKMDRDQVIKVKPMSELTAKIYNFKFKQDSDYYNELYRKRYSQGYGDRTYDSQFEFSQQKNEFEIVFSGTPLVGYGGEEKVYSTIFKQSNGNEETVDSNIRILQSKRITSLSTPWNILASDGVTVLATLTRYGYAGHFDNPDAPENDVNFGATRELFFVLATGNLSNNQFNVYWSGYMAEITDKDSKLVTASVYLNPADIVNLDFSKYVYIDGLLFRLNSIKNYNASKPATCHVELFKVNEFNFTDATPPEGPPEGNYLLWANDNIMYYDGPADDEELLWRGDLINPSINYSFDKNLVGGYTTGRMYIYKNSVLLTTFAGSTSGTIVVSPGDVIQFKIQSGTTIQKGLTVQSDIGGTLYDQPNGTTDKVFSWIAETDYTYTVTATIN